MSMNATFVQVERAELPRLHYVLCGEAEPGADLLSQAVLGGAAFGEDDEGFSGYGPARYFDVVSGNDE
jgi:hypothetical protein